MVNQAGVVQCRAPTSSDEWEPPGVAEIRNSDSWWRRAVVYQVYVRSFADANGDGTGDLGGVRNRLGYLRDLGVDALWFNPWYPSPMADSGYDVSDYRAIDPVFGTLAEAETLIDQARELGIRTIVDIVPNHVSTDHQWFREALSAGREPMCGTASGSDRAVDWTENCHPMIGNQSSAARPGLRPRMTTAPWVSGISTCSRRSSPI